jgi:hypothetical protein
MIIFDIYKPKVCAPNFIKHTLKDIKAHMDSNTVLVGDFNTPLLQIDRSSRQKINEEIVEINDPINLVNLTDVYRIFHPLTAQYIFFSVTYGTSSKIHQILGHKASLRKCRQIERNLFILSNHNAIKVELNNKSNSRKW